MKRLSDKTAERNVAYSALRRIVITGQFCQYPGCRSHATDVQHRRGRGLTFVLNVATWSLLCRRHHHEITIDPPLGKRLGLVESRHLQEIPLMPRRAIPRCRSCGHPLCWATTENGQSIPLIADANGEPVAHEDTGLAGRLQEVPADAIPGDLFGDKPDGLIVAALGKGQDADPDLPIWLTHFVNCPEAEEWRAANELETAVRS